jgi:hypothetical protein
VLPHQVPPGGTCGTFSHSRSIVSKNTLNTTNAIKCLLHFKNQQQFSVEKYPSGSQEKFWRVPAQTISTKTKTKYRPLQAKTSPIHLSVLINDRRRMRTEIPLEMLEVCLFFLLRAPTPSGDRFGNYTLGASTKNKKIHKFQLAFL